MKFILTIWTSFHRVSWYIVLLGRLHPRLLGLAVRLVSALALSGAPLGLGLMLRFLGIKAGIAHHANNEYSHNHERYNQKDAHRSVIY